MKPSTQKPDKKGYKKAYKIHAAMVRKEISRLSKLWRAGELSDDEHKAAVEEYRLVCVERDKSMRKRFNIPLPPYMS